MNEGDFDMSFVSDSTPAHWPEFEDDRLVLKWKGVQGKFTPRQRNQYALLRLLAESRGRHVGYLDIEERCMVKAEWPATIRQFKRRLVKTLKKMGMGDLAAVIEADEQNMWLNL